MLIEHFQLPLPMNTWYMDAQGVTDPDGWAGKSFRYLLSCDGEQKAADPYPEGLRMTIPDFEL